jgi:hypothetical protein
VGHISLASSLVGWALVVLAILSGGLDPDTSLGPVLKLATATAVGVSVLALGFGIAGLVRGRQRAAAAFGVASSLVFLLLFTGAGSAVFR